MCERGKSTKGMRVCELVYVRAGAKKEHNKVKGVSSDGY